MITHQEALELVRILFFNINEKTLQELNRTSKIYDKLDNYITQQEKKEKLLGLYRQLVLDLGLVIEYDTTDDWNGPVDYEYLEINDNGLEALKTYKKNQGERK